jgi:hypothetical protein
VFREVPFTSKKTPSRGRSEGDFTSGKSGPADFA